MSHMALVAAAYLRAAWEFPRLNRFIANKRIYQRNHFCMALVVLKPGDDNATMSKIYFDMEDDIFTIQEKVEKYVSENKVPQGRNSMDALMRALLRVPGLLGLGVGLIKLLDKLNLLPMSLIDASPFHASMTLSNLASIRTNHLYHHLYDFGTTSILITMGNMREVGMRQKGEAVLTRCLPLGVVMDERICSGVYFANAFCRIRAYLENPELLEGPPVAK
jgi:hypothetical protein